MTAHSSPSEWSASPRGSKWLALIFAVCVAYVPSASAQSDEDYEDYEEEESSFTINAMMKAQAGMFAPLMSDGFKAQKDRAYIITNPAFEPGSEGVCDPVVTPSKPCFPQNHGMRAGSPSIARATLQLEAHWDFSSMFALHAIVRAVRSAPLEADEMALTQTLIDAEPGQTSEEVGAARRAHAKSFAHREYYQELDLREFYLDFWPNDILSFRMGRQQLAWGETGQFRLLDVVNPADNTWHFGPLESFEDQRIPLWMLLTTIDIPQIESALELLYIPGVDKARNTVNPPLSMVGAWGLPYSNQPAAYQIREKDFRYPGGKLKPSNMRGGARLKGVLGASAGYSLVYMYTHMMRPVLTQVDLARVETPGGDPVYDATVADRAELKFPRKHVVGGSFEYTIDSPVATTLRFEGAVETNRTFSPNTNQQGDNNSDPSKITYELTQKPVVNYALVVQRPTMIRWLNPTQNFLLVAQFMHTAITKVDDVRDSKWVQLIGYNDWRIQKHSYTLVAHARTTYFHGIFSPRVTGVWMINPYFGDSGFVSVDLGFRIGPHYRVNVMVTDFIGKNAYRDIGLFRDRDELHASFTVLF